MDPDALILHNTHWQSAEMQSALLRMRETLSANEDYDLDRWNTYRLILAAKFGQGYFDFQERDYEPHQLLQYRQRFVHEIDLCLHV